MQKYKVIVIGGGHAGIEAALSAARMLGEGVALFTISLDSMGNMPCNPSIGGTGKGQLVFEIDALGGEMARQADEVMLQCRMLNLSKGPAVRSLRFQADRRRYQTNMKKTLENTKGLDILQAEVTELIFSGGSTAGGSTAGKTGGSADANPVDGTGGSTAGGKNGMENPSPTGGSSIAGNNGDPTAGKKKVVGVRTRVGDEFYADAVIIAAGTYLDSTIITGESHIKAGPDSMMYASSLSDCLRNSGVELMRFKTGTPARIHSGSIDYTKLEVQHGDAEIVHFSGDTDSARHKDFAQHKCHIAVTNERTHEIIRANLHRAPMYSGKIHGTGARYCPSIEDKVVRFADKERHHIFIEPMGIDTKEMYLQGFSTSMPTDVQREIIRSIAGLENAQIMRYAYAIEYDCCDPTQLLHTLEFRDIDGLYGAGQFNGTSGYEEAAAQGLVAGINAAAKLLGMPPLELGRDTSYIGMLIDDLVVKGTREPYRVMTSRTEYRLILRQDNADERLSEYGYRYGLVSGEKYSRLKEKLDLMQSELGRVKNLTVHAAAEVNAVLAAAESSPIEVSMKYLDLLRRPELNYVNTAALDPARPALPDRIFDCVLVRIHYEGYIRRQEAEILGQRKLETRLIPDSFDYTKYKGLSLEAVQKLSKMRPRNIGEAARISGVSPADITVLLILLSGGS